MKRCFKNKCIIWYPTFKDKYTKAYFCRRLCSVYKTKGLYVSNCSFRGVINYYISNYYNH